mgnify:CR=1 FL=1
MQRILQPGDIEALDHTRFPRVLLPQPAQLFADRAARLRQLAEGNPIADYLRFIAALADAQHHAAAGVQTEPAPAGATQHAQRHGMPLMPALDHLPTGWQEVLDTMLAELSGKAGLPQALQPLIEVLRTLDAQERDAIARRLLQNEGSARDVGLSPFVMAALQVGFACRAAPLDPADVPHAEPATVCPVCASAPVASVLRIGGEAGGHRYLHCGVCATEWHMVRVKCSHCASTQGIRYQGLEGVAEAGTRVKDQVVLAETCDQCHTYRKLVNQEKDPYAEPLADDLASLMLDLLMGETEFTRASGNPLLAIERPLAV